jgi:GNAT superfamily N-acetyltransferase
MFATATLARRIESAEAAMTSAFGEGLRARGRVATVQRLAGGVSVWAGPDSPFNKVIGLGFDPLQDATLVELEDALAERGAPVRVELSTLAPHSPAERLTRRGYVLLGFENVLALPIAGFGDPALAGISVERLSEEQEAVWIDTVATGFLSPDAVEGPPPTESFARDAIVRALEDVSAIGALERFVARREGAIAGGASLARFDGVALLAGAATLPAHRRRGVQGGLLQARLAYAARSGCDLAVVTTQPGSPSQANMQRHGFALLYARAILFKPAPGT